MTIDQVAIDDEAIRKATLKGVIAALILAVLTVIEYFVATSVTNPLLPLLPFVALKGWIILDVFMHVRALWSDDH